MSLKIWTVYSMVVYIVISYYSQVSKDGGVNIYKNAKGKTH